MAHPTDILNKRLLIIALPLVMLLVEGPASATVIQDPGGSDLSQVTVEGILPGLITETGLYTEEIEGMAEYEGEKSLAIYQSPFNTPLKEGETRYWVDPELGWIEYRVQDDLIILKNRAQMEYSDIHLEAHEVFYHTETKIIDAQGEAKLADSEGVVEGERMTYSFKTKKGVVYFGESEIETGFFRGERVKKVAEKILCASGGVFTSCEYAQSHYHFWSPKLKIYVGDKVIAKPVVMHLQGIPILALPYYILSLKRERHSGFLPPHLRYIGGHYYIINNGYFWAINDYCDLTAMLDYNSRKGWGQKVNFNYIFGSNTSVNSAYFAHYRERDTLKEWWKIYTSHRQEINYNTYALLRLDMRNDTSFDRYFDESFEVRTRKELASFATLSHRREHLSTTIEVSRTTSLTSEGTAEEAVPQYLESVDRDVHDLFPRISLSSPKVELWGTKFFLGWSGNFQNRYLNSELYNRSASTNISLSRPTRLLGFLQVEPSLSGSGEWYWQDKYGDPNLFMGNYTFRTTASTKIYGIFHPYDREFRHIIAPSVSYTYTPPYDSSWKPTGGSSSLGSNSIGLSLGQSFVLMPQRDEEGSSQGQATTILDWKSSISYNFKEEERPLSNLFTTMDIAPTFSDWYSINTRLTMRHDLYDLLLEQINFTTSLDLMSPSAVATREEEEETEEEGETYEDYLSDDPYRTDTFGQRQLGVGEGISKGWKLSLYYDYSKYRYYTSALQSIRGKFSLPITTNWAVSYETYYDIVNNRFQRQSFRIYRDLHCWEAEVRISYERSIVEYWFEIRIKEIPEVKLYGAQRRVL